MLWIWYLLNSPPGAIPNSLVRWADIDRSKRYITPYKYDVKNWHRYWQTLIIIMAKSQTWTVPWLLRISRDFSMSKFCASSKIVASSRCWNGQVKTTLKPIFLRDKLKHWRQNQGYFVYQDICPALAQLHHHNIWLHGLKKTAVEDLLQAWKEVCC